MRNIIFFDGHCVLCSKVVKTLLRWDRRNRLFFASLQGNFAKENHFYMDEDPGTQSLVYWREEKRVFRQSDAVIEILKDLFPWGRLFLALKLIPRPLRDGLYQYIARNRYRIWGQLEHCELNGSQSDRILD